MHPLKLRKLTVLRAISLTPRVRRITLVGPELNGFVTLSPEDHVKVFFSAPGERIPVLPMVTDEGRIASPADGRNPISRDYTPRRYDANAGELDIDFLLHDGKGAASAWAAQARPGDVVGIGGPRGSHLLTKAFDWYLLVGDETALPAIARRLEEWQGKNRVFAVIVVADQAEQQELCMSPASVGREAGGVEWVHCDSTDGVRAPALIEALRRLHLPVVARNRKGFAWVAGEASEVKSVRQFLTNECGMDGAQMDVSGHWQRGVVNRDHHQPVPA